MAKRDLLVGEVALEDLLERLSFSEEMVQEAAMEQAKLFMEAATYRIKKMKTRQKAENHLDEIKVHHSLKLRRTKSGGGKGFTEKYLTELVEDNSDVKVAKKELADAKRLEEWAKLLLDAYGHRRDSIKVLAQFAFMGDGLKLGSRGVERLKEERGKLKAMLPVKDEEDY